MARQSRGASRNYEQTVTCPNYAPVVDTFVETDTTTADIIITWTGTATLPGLDLFVSINEFPPLLFFSTGPATSGDEHFIDISGFWGVDDSVTIYAVLNSLPGPCPNQQSAVTEPVVWV